MEGKKGKFDGKFDIVLLGIVFDPKNRKILIGRRENDHQIENITWCFPGGRVKTEEEMEDILKNRIKLKTGLKVANLGSVYSRIFPEQKILLIYFLCEVIGGKEKPLADFVELKWVRPEELETHFTTSFHPHLKEYILNLK